MKFTLRNREITVFLKDLVLSKIFHIFILSFILRLLYVNVNAPFVFHPDEPTIVNSTINLRYNFNPKHFDWPTLTYYLNYPIYLTIEKVDAFFINYIGKDFDLVNFYNYYLYTRIITALIGSLAVLFLYFSLINFRISKNVSLVSSCIFSLMPFFLFRSAQALPDVPMLFFGILMIYFVSKHYVSDKYIYLLASSFCLGLAVSSKYTGYLFGITLLGYLFFHLKFSLNLIKSLVFCGILIVVGFLVGTPYALLDSKTFLISDSPKGALWQFQNVGKSDLSEQLMFFMNNLLFEELSNFGFIPQVCVILFVIFLVISKLRSDKFELGLKISLPLLYIFILQYFYIFWTVSGISSGSQRAQHFIPVIPFIIILNSLFFERIGFSRVKIIFIIFLLINTSVYLSRSEPEPIVKFYYKTVYNNLSVDNKDTVYYNQNIMASVLQKIGYEVRKFDEKKGLPVGRNKFFSNSNLCYGVLDCNLKTVYYDKNVFSEKELYIYLSK